MKNLALSIQAVDNLLFQLTRDAGFRIGHSVRTSQEEPNLRIIFDGPDAALLTEDNGALLEAIRHFVAEVLELQDDERHRIAFNLSFDQADLSWEFHRCCEAAIGLPTRSNTSCVSDELWEQLAQHSMGTTVLSMN